MRRVLTIALAVVCVSSLAWANYRAEKKTIKEVMKASMAGEANLCKKVVEGKASDDEKKKFLDLLIDLVENEPPKGDAIEWKMQSGTAMLAAAKVVTGREGSLDELKNAVNCKSCHDKFKGK